MFGWAAVLLAAQFAAGPETTTSTATALFTEARVPSAPAPPAASAGLPELTKLAHAAIPAVVGVVTTQAAPGMQDDGLKELFDKLHDGPRKGIGSGFVINREGWILTNAHVVEGADGVEIDLGEGAGRLPAKIVGMDSEADVALLKVDTRRPMAVVPLGDSDGINVAEWVLVIGSPFGLDHSVTLGIVSHTGRTDISPVGRPGSYDFIQTDASINPGNSGGPVLNLRGEVIGIATAVNATGQGIGFAIPINMAKEIVGQLKDRGRVVRSWLGVSVREAPGSPGDAPTGVQITDVARGGPADSAGLRIGDVITSIEGHLIHTPARLRWYVSMAGVGRQVDVRMRRGELPEKSVRIPLAEVPPEEQARAKARELMGE
jgi:serine protease Do